jgi:hypothetical protein
MRYQYQGTPATPPAPQLSLGSGNITAAKAGTKYLWMQYRNRAGYSAVSSVASTTVAATEKIIITIPTGAKPAAVGGVFGVDIQEYVILLSETNDITTAITVATFPGYQADGTPYALPATIELSRDQHLAIADLTVANEAALPANPVHGMRRAIASPSGFVAYDAVFSPVGWKPVYPQVFSTYVASTSAENGADVEIANIADPSVILTPSYGVDGTYSKSVGFWLANNDTNEIPTGTRIGLSFDLDNVDVSSQFVGLAALTFQGYATISTGALDVSAMIVNTTIPYSGAQTGMVLQKNLPVGSAIVIQVQLNFSAFQLANRPVQGSVLRSSLYLYGEFAQFDANGAINGSLIAAEYDRRRVVPAAGGNAAKALKGSGSIAIAGIGAYTFSGVETSAVVGLEPDTADQKVFLSINGSLYVAASAITGARQRAIVGTVNGIGHIKTWAGSYALTGSTALQIIATYPSTISGSYPDVIAGSSSGDFNASQIRIYVRPVGGGTIQYFDTNVLTGGPQTFTVGLTGTGTTVGSLPSDPANTFGLYRAVDGSYAISSVSGTSVFTTDNYEVAIAYIFDNRVTSIDHSAGSGNIYEASGTLAELYQSADYWKTTAATRTALRALPSGSYPNFHRRAIADIGLEVVWDASSYATDDDATIFKPSDRTIGDPGRYIAIVAQLNKNQIFRGSQAVQIVPVTFASPTTTIDLSLGNIEVTLTGNTAIAFTNYVSGSSWVVYLIQDATGGRIVTWDDHPSTGTVDWGIYGAPVLSTTPNKMDILTFVCRGSLIHGSPVSSGYRKV